MPKVGMGEGLSRLWKSTALVAMVDETIDLAIGFFAFILVLGGHPPKDSLEEFREQVENLAFLSETLSLRLPQIFSSSMRP